MNLVEQIASETGRSKVTIYKLAKRLGRIPTKEEVLNRKNGRPSIFNSKGERK